MASARLAAGFRPLRVELSGSVVTGAESGSGAPLVLLHGLGGTWEYWGRTIALLSDRARCIALDLPGFGHSDEPRRRIRPRLGGATTWPLRCARSTRVPRPSAAIRSAARWPSGSRSATPTSSPA